MYIWPGNRAYCILYRKTLHLLQLWQALHVLCRDSDYLWDNANVGIDPNAQYSKSLFKHKVRFKYIYYIMAQNLFPSTILYIVRMLLGEKIFCEAGQAWYMVIMLGYSATLLRLCSSITVITLWPLPFPIFDLVNVQHICLFEYR